MDPLGSTDRRGTGDMTTYTFTITASFDADDRDEAWDMWAEWLTDCAHVVDGTTVTENDS